MISRDIDSADARVLTAVMDSLAEAVILLDVQGRITYANRALADGMGVPRESLLGRRWDDPIFVVEDTEGRRVPPEERAFARVRRSGQPIIGEEFVLYPPKGGRVRAIYNAVPMSFDGEFVGVVVTLTDITARAEAEDARRQTEAQLLAFVQQSRHGMFIVGADGEVLVTNRALERITGHKAEEFEGRSWIDVAFTDPEERERARTWPQRTMSGDLPYLEERYTKPDGSKVWLSYAVTPIQLDDGFYVAGIVTDITERKEAEEKARFRVWLLDQVRNAVVASDMEGRITYINDEAERLYGWHAHDVIGQTVGETVLAGQGQPARDLILGTIVADGSWEGESVVRAPDGSETPIILSLSLLRDEQGRPQGVVGIAIDIGDLKAAQRQLEEKDHAIRQAYVDVISAVTGGKLVLVTPDEMDGVLGRQLVDREGIRFDTLAESRHAVQDVMSREGIVTNPAEAIIAYGEAATNALKHASGGRYAIYRTPRALQVLVSDDGEGIDFRNLPRATLMSGFSTGQTLGVGFTVMLEITDRMLLATRPGGTEVLLEFALG